MANHNEPLTKLKLRRNFGHRPRNREGLLKRTFALFTAVFGISNLHKRQQVRDLFDTIAPNPSDTILDFGCSSGYITMEMARYAGNVIGLDIK